MKSRPGMRPCTSWRRTVRWLFGSIATMSLGITAAAAQKAQQSDQLKQQLEELKQESEANTHALELRIAALEQQIEKE